MRWLVLIPMPRLLLALTGLAGLVSQAISAEHFYPGGNDRVK